jgi:glycerol kinase
VASLNPISIAVDAGTTGVRSLVVDERAAVVDLAYRELTQHFPRPGWVEHDADEIWRAVRDTLGEVAGRLAGTDRVARSIGVTNQRETVVAWDRATGAPLHRALVWQDRRTADRCAALHEAGHLPLVRERTGLVLDPYFSGSKMQWLLEEGGVPTGPDLALATVDTWVLWNLTGGADGGAFATDVTNASRTMLLDIVLRRWSPELCDLFGVPTSALAEVGPSCGRFGTVASSVLGDSSPLKGVPVSAMIGDQHAALFGQACFDRGMTKATFGTGSFILMNAGDTCPPPVDGLLTTVAWDLGTVGGAALGSADGERADRGPLAYAVEGSIFVAGAGVQWLRDGLGIIAESAELEPLARSVGTSEGVVIVPAFTGLGSPHWDPGARGTITGLSRGIGRAHLARAMIEAMGFQVRDVLEAMAGTGTAPSVVRVDGGAAVMGLLLQHLADQARLEVLRPESVETTALGAATMAGLAEGVWGTLDDLTALWSAEAAFVPEGDEAVAVAAHRSWLRSVDRSRHWVVGAGSGPPGP